jgi:hypothetical protein
MKKIITQITHNIEIEFLSYELLHVLLFSINIKKDIELKGYFRVNTNDRKIFFTEFTKNLFYKHSINQIELERKILLKIFPPKIEVIWR